MEPSISAATARLVGLTGWTEPTARLVLLAACGLLVAALLALLLRRLVRRGVDPAVAASTAASIDRLQELGNGFADTEASEAAVFIAKVSRNLLTKGPSSGGRRKSAGILLGAHLPLALRAATALRQIEAGGRDGRQAVAALKDLAIGFYDHLQGRQAPNPEPMEARVALAEVQALKAWDGGTTGIVPEADRMAPRA